MALTPLVAIIRKNLQLFSSDRRALVMSFVMPIAIASFFGMIFGSPRNADEVAKIPAVVVDQDNSAISRQIVAGVSADKNLSVRPLPADEARAAVRRGDAAVGIIIPTGFGDAAGRAFFRGTEKPQLDLLYDPSHGPELAMVRGLLTQHVMESVSREMFAGARGQQLIDETLAQLDTAAMAADQKQLLRDMLGSVRKYNAARGTSTSGAPGLSMPYSVREDAVTARGNVAYNGMAHAFAGMSLQFVLFAALNLGVEVLLERQRGLWKRLRTAPVSRTTLMFGQLVSASIIAALILLVSFGFCIIVYGVRIDGSWLGFLGVALTCALMAGSYGLLVASLGKTPNGARAAAIPATLIMVMLGGAWVPTFIFPRWLQRMTVVVPTRWAVDGFDAMTWRGLGFDAAIVPILVLLGFAAAFWLVAVSRFRWEEA
jgi:ABC-2 type transport system permease protein